MGGTGGRAWLRVGEVALRAMNQEPRPDMGQWFHQLIAELWRIIRREPPELLEIVASLQAGVWGVWLLLPFPSMSVSSVSAGALLTPFTERYFGAWFLLVCCCKFLALSVGSRRGRQAVSALLLVSWAFVAYQFHLVSPLGPAVATYGFIVCIHVFLFARLVASNAS
jgi:hypothetical protein